MSFQRADVSVILWFRDPAYPEVVAALVGDSSGTRGDCACGAAHHVPSSYWELCERLTALGALVEPDEFGLLAKVTYGGQDVGTVSAGEHVPLPVVHTDWWRTVWWMQAVDQRGPVY